MAIYVDNYNLCFIHSPKTGGSSIQKWLLDNTSCEHWKLHCNLSKAKQKFPAITHSFAVVRNPWDWAVSCYFYEYKKIAYNLDLIKNKPHLINEQKDKYNVELQNQKKVLLDKGFEHWLYNSSITPQSVYLENIDYILKFESLDKDFQIIQKIINVDIPLPHINKTTKDNYSKYYTLDTINYILNKYTDTINKFGYKYEAP